jgi:hypothetical protein
MEGGRNAFKILIDKPIGNRPLGRLRRGWEDNIIMDLKEISVSTTNWIDSTHDNQWECFQNFNREIYRKETSRKT